jgi:hypothetical protein
MTFPTRTDGRLPKNKPSLRARAAIERLANGAFALAVLSHGTAYNRLKEVNKAKREARPPPDSSNSKVVEYIYGYYGDVLRVTKKTSARIFYVNDDDDSFRYGNRSGYVDRRLVLSKWPETKRELWNDDRVFMVGRSRQGRPPRKYGYRSCFWTVPMPDCLKHRDGEDAPVDIKKLKAEMAAAHPDRGGNSKDFIEKRQRYLAAKRAMV